MTDTSQDATNVSRILSAIAERDVIIEPNSRGIHPNNTKKWPWMGRPGEIKWEEWMSDNKKGLLDSQKTAEAAETGAKKENGGVGMDWILQENVAGQLVAVKTNSGDGDQVRTKAGKANKHTSHHLKSSEKTNDGFGIDDAFEGDGRKDEHEQGVFSVSEATPQLA